LTRKQQPFPNSWYQVEYRRCVVGCHNPAKYGKRCQIIEQSIE
jgi:hypothetical protein